MVLPVVVASETETRGGREKGWKWLVCAVLALLLRAAVSPELRRKAGLCQATELRRERMVVLDWWLVDVGEMRSCRRPFLERERGTVGDRETPATGCLQGRERERDASGGGGFPGMRKRGRDAVLQQLEGAVAGADEGDGLPRVGVIAVFFFLV